MIILKSLLLESMTDTPEFKKWFGKSKIVNDKGNPLVCYHMTTKNITTFNPEKRTHGYDAPREEQLVGSYFTPIKDYKLKYVGERMMTYLVFLKIENPLKLPIHKTVGISRKHRDEILKQGYDGVIGGENTGFDEIVVFNPNQIKSVFGNNGNFDPNNSDITKETFNA